MPEAAVNAEMDRTKTLLRRFELPLLQFATRITGDRERARDIVQETFIQFERKGPVSQNGEPATWLFTVCRNRALNVCRKEKRMLFLDEELIEVREDEQPMPYEQLEQKEATGFLLLTSKLTNSARNGHLVVLRHKACLTPRSLVAVDNTLVGGLVQRADCAYHSVGGGLFVVCAYLGLRRTDIGLERGAYRLVAHPLALGGANPLQS